MRKATLTALLLFAILTPGRATAAGRSHVQQVLWSSWQQYWITGYCYGQITATGTRARWGEVAVDPGVVPLGSWLQIRGLGDFHAEDTGGAVVGRHIDVFTTCAAAYQLTGWHAVRLRR